MNQDELKQLIEDLGPWHYCHALNGLPTGTSPPDSLPEKMDWFFNHNTFDRPSYPRVLDLGANSGIISMWFVDNKRSVVDAVERGPKYFPQLELAVKIKKYEGRVIPLNYDIHTWPMGQLRYDLVLLLGTLHHLREEQHRDILNRCRKVLVPGGQIVVQTKTSLPVARYLEDVGFLFVQKEFDMPGFDRSAWKAQKDAMKI